MKGRWLESLAQDISESERAAVISHVDAELDGLSAIQREAIILRYLRGFSEQAAATAAGCPLGTMKRRASDGLAKLRARLSKRGIALGGAALAGLLTSEASAAVPETLLPSILAAVKTDASTGAAATTATTTAAMLANGAMKAMYIAKVKMVAAVAAVVVVTGTAVPVGIAMAQKEKAMPSAVAQPGGGSEISASQAVTGTMAVPRGAEASAAVNSALRWLVLHQEPAGWWSPRRWDPDDVAVDAPATNDVQNGVIQGHVCGVTGLGALALMGGGHTLNQGEHRLAVQRSIQWLMDQQDPKTGYIKGEKYTSMYEHAIATIALCEAFGRSPDEKVGLAAPRAVDACVAAVGKDGGWRYTPNPDNSDVSVTSWFLQALKTAKLANLKIDDAVRARGLAFIDSCTDKDARDNSNGMVGYMGWQGVTTNNNPPALTCAGMLMRRFNGMDVKHPLLVRGAELTRQLPPNWEKKNFYYWYYATYAMHNMGGEYRLLWNTRIRETLLDHQTQQGHQAGSWSPDGDQTGAGRAYTTALGALCLEVYHRYGEDLQSFGTVPGSDQKK